MDRETREILKASPLGTIIVNLDGNRVYNTISLKEFKIAIRNQERCIITPLTYALDNHYCLMGYKLIIESEGHARCINDMLLGKIGENERERRIAHNVEKLFMSGAYEDIETEWE